MKKAFKQNKNFSPMLLYTLFGILFFCVCGFVFIANYKKAYDNTTGGGFIPYSFAVKTYYFFILLGFCVLALIIKLIFIQKIKLRYLLLISTVMTFLCYTLNYYSLYPDIGIFYPLVDEGGIFYFIRNGDYNFDGINDKQYYLETATRTESGAYGTESNDYISTVSYEVTGVGRLNSVVCLIYDSDSPSFDYDAALSYAKEGLVIDKVILEFRFKEEAIAKNATVLLKGETITAPSLPQSHTSADTITVTLDKEFFEKHSASSEKSKVYFCIGVIG